MTENHLLIGIDLGGSTLKAANVATTGEILDEFCIDADQQTADRAIAQIAGAVKTLRGKRPDAQVKAIGLGIPGLVNSRTNRIEILPNLPALSDVDISSKISAETGLPVVLDNDANAAAYGELQAGVAVGRKDVFYVSLGA